MFKNFSKIICLTIIFFSLPSFVSAAFVGQIDKFFVDSNYDISEREEISARLQKIGSQTYFYLEQEWWKGLSQEEKNQLNQGIQDLDLEFQKKIYPVLTKTFGSEWNPGIDKDARITVLIHPMVKGIGGYFRSADEYPRLLVSDSNEKEMLYLNSDYISATIAKSFLAHEFVHLIIFNQKERLRNVEEEVWLNEARAEYAPTLLGYDDEYKGSNLQARAKVFLAFPFDSLVEWQNKESDYGVLNLFTQYLVEKYGIEILSDSLKSKETGINSLNKALKKNNFEEDFAQIFTDWTITVLINDCSLGEEYCYENENLKNLRVVPSMNFLPLKGKSALGVTQTSKNWSGNWFKFVGGKGTLKIEFIGNPENLFKIPYLAKDIDENYFLDFFQLDEYQRGEILVSKFGTEISSVTIIPSIQSKISGFLNPEPSFPFFWEASTMTEIEEVKDNSISIHLDKSIEKMTKEEISAKISEIEELLNRLIFQFARIEAAEKMESISCQEFEQDLYYGLKKDSGVYCLQEFLTAQGREIYPEGLVTGNFLSLTKAAVIRFQEKHAAEILEPLGLEKGTGFVGSMTKKKINEILNK